LSKEEVDRLIREAKENEEKDKLAKELIEKRNALDQLIASVEKSLFDAQGKATDADIEVAKAAVEKAKNTLKDNPEDKEALEKEYQELLQSSGKVAQAVYDHAAKEKTEANNAAPGQDNDQKQPMDAEFEDKK
jgi:molecular chaperone DnaK